MTASNRVRHCTQRPHSVMAAAFEDWKALLVVAIDVGTTYAMSFASTQNEIQAIREADSNADRVSGCPQPGKVPTGLLLQPDGTFDVFGFKARSRCNELVDSNPENQKTWMYFERFKQDLHNSKTVSWGAN